MNREERNELLKKIGKYDSLNTKMKCMEEILGLPYYVKTHYGKQEDVRINMSFTFGNGTSHYDIIVNEDDYAFNKILEIISEQKEITEEQISSL